MIPAVLSALLALLLPAPTPREARLAEKLVELDLAARGAPERRQVDHLPNPELTAAFPGYLFVIADFPDAPADKLPAPLKPRNLYAVSPAGDIALLAPPAVRDLLENTRPPVKTAEDAQKAAEAALALEAAKYPEQPFAPAPGSVKAEPDGNGGFKASGAAQPADPAPAPTPKGKGKAKNPPAAAPPITVNLGFGPSGKPADVVTNNNFPPPARPRPSASAARREAERAAQAARDAADAAERAKREATPMAVVPKKGPRKGGKEAERAAEAAEKAAEAAKRAAEAAKKAAEAAEKVAGGPVAPLDSPRLKELMPEANAFTPAKPKDAAQPKGGPPTPPVAQPVIAVGKDGTPQKLETPRDAVRFVAQELPPAKTAADARDRLETLYELVRNMRTPTMLTPLDPTTIKAEPRPGGGFDVSAPAAFKIAKAPNLEIKLSLDADGKPLEAGFGPAKK